MFLCTKFPVTLSHFLKPFQICRGNFKNHFFPLTVVNLNAGAQRLFSLPAALSCHFQREDHDSGLLLEDSRLFTGLSQCDKPGRRPGPARAGRSSRPLVAVPAGGGTVCNVVLHPASHGQSRPRWLTRSAPGPARRASAPDIMIPASMWLAYVTHELRRSAFKGSSALSSCCKSSSNVGLDSDCDDDCIC